MKLLLFFTALFFSLSLTAQIKTDSIPTPAKGRDFNYTFFPNDIYKRVGTFWKVDSTTLSPDGKTMVPTLQQFTDTSSQKTQVVIEHEGDQLKIYNLFDQSQVHYKAQVRFLGITIDQTNALAYQALTPTGEVIYVNPITGYAVIIFNVPLDKNPKKSNVNIHYFGNVPTGPKK